VVHLECSASLKYWLACLQIVVLCDKGMEEMREAIDEHDIDMKNNKLMLRQGCILSVSELRKVSAQHAR